MTEKQVLCISGVCKRYLLVFFSFCTILRSTVNKSSYLRIPKMLAQAGTGITEFCCILKLILSSIFGSVRLKLVLNNKKPYKLTKEKKEIWLSPMTKTPIPTENSKTN